MASLQHSLGAQDEQPRADPRKRNIALAEDVRQLEEELRGWKKSYSSRTLTPATPSAAFATPLDKSRFTPDSAVAGSPSLRGAISDLRSNQNHLSSELEVAFNQVKDLRERVSRVSTQSSHPQSRSSTPPRSTTPPLASVPNFDNDLNISTATSQQIYDYVRLSKESHANLTNKLHSMQRMKDEQFKSYQNEIKHLKSKLFDVEKEGRVRAQEMQVVRAALEATANEKERLQRKLHAGGDNMDEVIASRDEAREQLKRERHAAQIDRESEKRMYDGIIRELEQDCATLRDRLDTVALGRKRDSRIASEIAAGAVDRDSSYDHVKASHRRLKEDIDGHMSHIDTLEKHATSAVHAATSSTNIFSDLQNKLNTVNTRNRELEQEVHRLKSQLSESTNNVENKARDVATLQLENGRLLSKMNALSQELEGARDVVATNIASTEALRSASSNYQRSALAAEEQLGNLSAKIEQLNLVNDKLNQELLEQEVTISELTANLYSERESKEALNCQLHQDRLSLVTERDSLKRKNEVLSKQAEQDIAEKEREINRIQSEFDKDYSDWQRERARATADQLATLASWDAQRQALEQQLLDAQNSIKITETSKELKAVKPLDSQNSSEELKNSNMALEKCRNEVSQLKKEIELCRKDIDSSKKEALSSSENLNSIRNEKQALQDEMQSNRSQLKSLLADVEKYKSQIESLVAEHAEAEQLVESLRQQLKEEKRDYEEKLNKTQLTPERKIIKKASNASTTDDTLTLLNLKNQLEQQEREYNDSLANMDREKKLSLSREIQLKTDLDHNLLIANEARKECGNLRILLDAEKSTSKLLQRQNQELQNRFTELEKNSVKTAFVETTENNLKSSRDEPLEIDSSKRNQERLIAMEVSRVLEKEQEKLDNLTKEKNELMEQYDKNIKKLTADNKNYGSVIAGLEKELATYKNEVEDLRLRADRDRKAQLEMKASPVRGEAVRLREMVEMELEEQFACERTRDAAKISSLESEIVQLKLSEKRLKQLLEDQKCSLNELIARKNEAETKLSQLSSRNNTVSNLGSDNGATDGVIESLVKERDSLLISLQEMKDQVKLSQEPSSFDSANKQAEIDSLEQRINQLEAAALSSMKKNEEGGNTSLYERIAELELKLFEAETMLKLSQKEVETPCVSPDKFSSPSVALTVMNNSSSMIPYGSASAAMSGVLLYAIGTAGLGVIWALGLIGLMASLPVVVSQSQKNRRNSVSMLSNHPSLKIMPVQNDSREGNPIVSEKSFVQKLSYDELAPIESSKPASTLAQRVEGLENTLSSFKSSLLSSIQLIVPSTKKTGKAGDLPEFLRGDTYSMAGLVIVCNRRKPTKKPKQLYITLTNKHIIAYKSELDAAKTENLRFVIPLHDVFSVNLDSVDDLRLEIISGHDHLDMTCNTVSDTHAWFEALKDAIRFTEGRALIKEQHMIELNPGAMRNPILADATYDLKIVIHRGRFIERDDARLRNSVDYFYCVFRVGGVVLVSKVAEISSPVFDAAVTWNETLTVKVEDPLSHRIECAVYRKDHMSGVDDYCGGAEFNVAELLSKQRWFHGWVRLCDVKSGELKVDILYEPVDSGADKDSDDNAADLVRVVRSLPPSKLEVAHSNGQSVIDNSFGIDESSKQLHRPLELLGSDDLFDDRTLTVDELGVAGGVRLARSHSAVSENPMSVVRSMSKVSAPLDTVAPDHEKLMAAEASRQTKESHDERLRVEKQKIEMEQRQAEENLLNTCSVPTLFEKQLHGMFRSGKAKRYVRLDCAKGLLMWGDTPAKITRGGRPLSVLRGLSDSQKSKLKSVSVATMECSFYVEVLLQDTKKYCLELTSGTNQQATIWYSGIKLLINRLLSGSITYSPSYDLDDISDTSSQAPSSPALGGRQSIVRTPSRR